MVKQVSLIKYSKLLLACCLPLNMSYANDLYSAEVQVSEVIITINDESKSYKAGSIFNLKENDFICFISGNGEVSIKGDNYKVRLYNKTATCELIPSKKKKGVFNIISDTFSWLFPDNTNEQENSEGSVIGMKGGSQNKYVDQPIIMGNKKYLIIKNDSWGPLPIVLNIINNKGVVEKTSINDDDEETLFIIPRMLLKEGYTINISNAFGDTYVNSQIHLSTQQKDK